MNLKEIINRDFSETITQEECLFVLHEYIKVRKNIEVNPIIDIISIKGQLTILPQIQKMIELTNTAIIWYKNNPDKISN